MADKLQQAIAAIKAGDKVAGRQRLAEVIIDDPNSETAWLWMTAVVDDQQKKQECLHKVLRINPDNQAAREALARMETPSEMPVSVDLPQLEAEAPQPTPDTAPATDWLPSTQPEPTPSPETPPDLTTADQPAGASGKGPKIVFLALLGIALLAVCCLLAGVAYLQFG